MINTIVAVSENGIIGVNNQIPWKNKEDMAFFKEKTLNSTIIMGRKTHESIMLLRGKPLDNRRNIVISSTKQCVETYNSLSSCLEDIGDGNIWIIGGSRLYNEAISCCKTQAIYLNKIHTMVDYKHSDEITTMPWIDPTKYMVISVTPKDTFTTICYLRST